MSLETAKRVLRIEAEAIEGMVARLDARFDRAVELLFQCKGRVVVTGMGKSGLIGRKIAATFSSTGTPSVFLHPAEAVHGDLGMLVREDVLLAFSYGGETEEIIALLDTLKRLSIPMVTLTGNPRSTLAAASDVVLDISVKEEACSLNLAPTASTAASMAMGDALAIALLERRGFGPGDFAVHVSAKMPDVIYEMSQKGLGMTTVVEDSDRLAGILTDGDLRRLMQRRKGAAFELTAGECMTRDPVTIAPGELASAALSLMERRKITAVVVVDEEKCVRGVVHVHDLWTLELF